MSVFTTQATTLPPRYSSTRPQPPPYKPEFSKSLAPSLPPPIYKTTSNTTISSSGSSSPSCPTSTLPEPPQYASIISAPKPKPQPTATRVRDLPTWKDPYVETDAADSIYQLQQRESRQRVQEVETQEQESSNWCLGCFWWFFSAQPDRLHWSTYGPYMFF